MTISPSELQSCCINSPQNTDRESHQSPQIPILKKPSPEMETKKRAAALAAVCVLLLMLSGQRPQQLAAMSFCDCYQQCHPWCRHSNPWWLCNVGCAGQCDGGDRDDTLAACTMVCTTDSVCGLSEVASADGVEDCVRECNKRWGHN